MVSRTRPGAGALQRVVTGWEQETVWHRLYTVGTGFNWALHAGGSLAERLCKKGGWARGRQAMPRSNWNSFMGSRRLRNGLVPLCFLPKPCMMGKQENKTAWHLAKEMRAIHASCRGRERVQLGFTWWAFT